MTVIVALRLTPEEKDLWTKMAKSAKPPMTLSAWIKRKCGSLPDDDSSPVPSRKPRPLPPRVPVNAVPDLPDGPEFLEDKLLPGPDLAVMPFDKQASIPSPPDFDVLEDLPPLEPSDAEFEALLPTPAEMAVIMGERSLKTAEQNLEDARDAALVDLMEKSRPTLPPVSQPEPKPARKQRPGFKRAAKCTSSKCERLQLPTCDACIRANADGVDEMEIVPPEPTTVPFHGTVSVIWQGKHFKRHPKCVTEKCERLGPSCELCRQANAIGF